MRRVATLLLIATALSACGQKGNLYLPDAGRDAVVTSEPATPAASPATPNPPAAAPPATGNSADDTPNKRAK